MPVPPRHKLKNIMEDLRDMKRDLLPARDKDGNAIDTSDPNLDDFQRKTLALTKLLEEIRPDFDREAKLRAVPDADREMRVQILRLSSDNRASLQKAAGLWKDAQQQLVLASSRAKWDADTLSNRKDALRLLSEEMKELSAKNSSVHAQKSADEKAIDAKRAQRKTRTGPGGDAKRDRRRRGGAGGAASSEFDDDGTGGGPGGSAGAGGGGGGGGGGGEIEMRPAAASAEDTQFMAEVQANRQAQDKMLDEILVGVNELGDLAGALSTEIKVQSELIDEAGTKIANTSQTLKTQTAKLQELLDESGGACRWVPMLLCVLILLALIGFLYHMVTS